MASQGTKLFDSGRFPTRAHRQRRACIQCTSAKRKCGKEAPSCARCREKGIVCSYAQRPNVRSGNTNRGAEQGEGGTLALSSRPPQPHSSLPEATSGHRSSAATGSHCRWFLSAESWVLHRGRSSRAADDPPSPVGEETLPRFISKVKAWAADWVRDGHSPLMHKHLYRGWLPDCLQDCLTSLTAYTTASSDSAKATVLRIIDDRVNRLIQGQPQLNNNNSNDDNDNNEDDDWDLNPSILLSTPTHLARTQALFIYQLIRLFDGDIRARAQAEQHIPTLLTWAKQMVESARLDCACADLLPLSPSPNPPHQHPPPRPTGDTNMNTNMDDNPFTLPPDPLLTPIPSLWRAWIHAESVRRVYTAAVYMQNVYDTLRRGWSICPGTVAFTAQSGLWDAGSGYVWMERLRGGAAAAAAREKVAGRDGSEAGMMGAGSSGGGGGGDDGYIGEKQESPELPRWVMVQNSRSAYERILQDALPGEIDEFTVGVLELIFGVESVEEWMFERGRGLVAGMG